MAGSRSGNPIVIGRAIFKALGQPAGALLLSNGRSQSEVKGPGVAASVVTQHGRLAGWALGQLDQVVGELKHGEAATEISEARDALQAGMFTAEALQKIVKLLGGRKRSQRWSASDAGIGHGAWGNHLLAADLRRAMRAFASILGKYYGGVFGMNTDLSNGSDSEEAFGLAALTDNATDNLTIENAFTAIVLGFESFQRDCERYRTMSDASLPCLTTALRAVGADVIRDMQKAQTTDEQVATRVEKTLSELGYSAAGQKRDAGGNPTGGKPAAGGQQGAGAGAGADAGLTKSQKERARRKRAQEKAKLAGQPAPVGTPAGSPAPTAPGTPTPTGKAQPQLLLAGTGFQLFAPDKPYDSDLAVCKAWGKAYFAGGTGKAAEPCGWMACFGRCAPKAGACERDHACAWPANLKAALKANSEQAEAARFAA